MSTNVFNITSPIIVDLNRYVLSDMNIEFRKDFLKSNTTVRPNMYYNYGIIPSTNGINIPVEFNKDDSTAYVKIKNTDLWLHMDDNNNFYFDTIRDELFYYRQPLLIWFLHNKNDEVCMYRYFGKGLWKVNETTNEGISNTKYIYYKQNGNQIMMKWVADVNDATKIIVQKIEWQEYALDYPVNLKKKRY